MYSNSWRLIGDEMASDSGFVINAKVVSGAR